MSLQDLSPPVRFCRSDAGTKSWMGSIWVGLALAALAALPLGVAAQAVYSCQVDGAGEVCYSPPSIQYAVFGWYQGVEKRVYGVSREDACLNWVAATPNNLARGSYVGVRQVSGLYFYCAFKKDGFVDLQYDGDNRQIKVCPVNAVMYDADGTYKASKYSYSPGALYLNPTNVGNSMPDASTRYPSSVFHLEGGGNYDKVMCAARGAPLPIRNLGPTCPSKGNPINLGAEIKTQREVDYDRNGALRFVRTYNSGVGTTYYTGVLGIGWQHNLAVRISASTDAATVWRGDGRIVSFALVGGVWISWPDVNDRLTELKDGLGVRTGWRYLSATSGDAEWFDKDGKLTSVVTQQGATLTLSYSDGTAAGTNGSTVDGASTALPAGLLLRATDSLGSTLSFGYNTANRLVRVIRPDGLEIRYTYSVNGNLDSALYPSMDTVGNLATQTRSYLYENTSFPSALTGITDESGQRLSTYTYDAFGRAMVTEHAGGAGRYSLNVNSTNSTTVTDPLGAQQTYTFDYKFGAVHVASQSQPAGSGCGPASSAITYDANANVDSRTDFDGHKTCYAYNLTRNLETKRVEGLSSATACSTALTSPPVADTTRVITTDWHPDWRLETKRAEPKRITTWIYNGYGAVCAPADALVDGKPIAAVCSKTEQATTDETGVLGFAGAASGSARTFTYTYNRWGQLLTSNGPRSDVVDTTTYEYYPDTQPNWTLGDLKQTTNPAGHVTRFTQYNRHGQVLQRVDANGLVTNYTYDLRQRLTRITTGDEQTAYEYDPVGNLKKVTLPDGGFIAYTYDAAHRLIQVDDHKGNKVVYTLDAMGNRIAEKATDPSGALVRNLSRVVDALNRVQQVVGGQ